MGNRSIGLLASLICLLLGLRAASAASPEAANKSSVAVAPFFVVLDERRFGQCDLKSGRISNVRTFSTLDKRLATECMHAPYGGAVKEAWKEQVVGDAASDSLYVLTSVVPVHQPGDSFYGYLPFLVNYSLSTGATRFIQPPRRCKLTNAESGSFHQTGVAFDTTRNHVVICGECYPISGAGRGCVFLSKDDGKWGELTLGSVANVIAYDAANDELVILMEKTKGTIGSISRFSASGVLKSTATLSIPLSVNSHGSVQINCSGGEAFVLIRNGNGFRALRIETATGAVIRNVPAIGIDMLQPN